MLEHITPLILTRNEASNIGRTLDQLRWARDIVVVDSFSDDDTLKIISSFPQVRVVQREFDNHASQWNFGLKETAIDTDWVMALDADFVLSESLIADLQRLHPAEDVVAYRAPFVFCINGHKLRSAVCPPTTFLFRRQMTEYIQEGHTQKVKTVGRIESLSSPVFHDDRKPLARWFQSQQRYAKLDAQKMISSARADLDFPDRVRRLRIVAPLAMFIYCLIIRGGILDGRAGWFYSCQRALYELMLSLHLLEHDVCKLEKAQTTESVDQVRSVPRVVEN